MSIALNHITLSYGSRTLLEDVTAAFAQGSLTALIGRNGTGKSTLLRAIAGLGTTVSGDVALCGRPLASLTPHELSTTVGFVTTDKVRIANLACEDVVALGRAPYTNWIGRMQEADRAVVERRMLHIGLSLITSVINGTARQIKPMSQAYLSMTISLTALRNSPRWPIIPTPIMS